MAWKKKIEKSVSGDLQPGENLIEGLLINPSGYTMKLAAKGVGGLVGSAIASRVMKEGEVDSSSGNAAQIPNEPLVLGVTDRRLIIWSFGKMMGKPKELLFAFPLTEVAGMELESKKASVAVALMFSDGSGISREAPKLANDPEAFAAALNGLTNA